MTLFFSCSSAKPEEIEFYMRFKLSIFLTNGINQPFCMYLYWTLGFPCGSAGKESTCNARDLGSIPGLGRSSREGKGYPLQYSGLENSMDCIVHGVSKSQTQLSNFDILDSKVKSGCLILVALLCAELNLGVYLTNI